MTTTLSLLAIQYNHHRPHAPLSLSPPPPWTKVHTSLVKEIKTHVKSLPCLGILTDTAFKIVETDASDIGYGRILKQIVSPGSPEQIVRFHSGSWNKAPLSLSLSLSLSLTSLLKTYQS